MIILNRERFVRQYLIEKYIQDMERVPVYFNVNTGDLYAQPEGHCRNPESILDLQDRFQLTDIQYPIYTIYDQYIGYYNNGIIIQAGVMHGCRNTNIVLV